MKFKCALLRLFTQNLSMNRKPTSTDSSAPPAKKMHWSHGLLHSMKDPNSVVKEDELVVAIRDKYPKARFHFLIIPREDIPSIRDVIKSHESLLEHMDKVGRELAAQHPEYSFMFGYHAVPSMYRLHLHVISSDLDSPCLKNKYHWNSFTTPFFLPSEEIIRQLKEEGELKPIDTAEQENNINSSIACHKCSYTPKNMPDLKKHILQHAPKT